MKTEISAVGQRARRRIAIRLLPFVFAMYVVCFVDRVNVSFANLRMSADLGFSDRAYGLGVGIFFIGYVLFEVPGSIIVERWSARKWLARIMISWGLATVFSGFIHSAGQFYAARFLVGVTEASFFPGLIVYLTHWFRHSDRAKAIAFFYSAVPAASVVGSLVASWLLGIHWLGVTGWRWLFILEGIPPIVLGIATLFYLTDWPRQARWLPEDERDWITAELEAETKAKKGVRDYSIGQAFRDRRVLWLMLVWFLALAGSNSSIFWLPTFIKRVSGLPNTTVAFLMVLPGLAGIAGMLLNGWHSDKTDERRWHATIPLACAGAAYLMVLAVPGRFPPAMALFIVATGGIYAFNPVLWAMPTTILCESAAAASFGLINSIGQIGGFVGPYAVGYLNDRTGSLAAAFTFIGACYLLGASIVPFLNIRSPRPLLGANLTSKESAAASS
jgi:ACS family tartrate transporter-like MFS transporter